MNSYLFMILELNPAFIFHNKSSLTWSLLVYQWLITQPYYCDFNNYHEITILLTFVGLLDGFGTCTNSQLCHYRSCLTPKVNSVMFLSTDSLTQNNCLMRKVRHWKLNRRQILSSLHLLMEHLWCRPEQNNLLYFRNNGVYLPVFWV